VLSNTPNEPVVELITADVEVGPDVPDVDEVNNVEKNADPEIEEDEAEASQTKEHNLLKMPEGFTSVDT
jgi:hypothetical protein